MELKKHFMLVWFDRLTTSGFHSFGRSLLLILVLNNDILFSQEVAPKPSFPEGYFSILQRQQQKEKKEQEEKNVSNPSAPTKIIEEKKTEIIEPIIPISEYEILYLTRVFENPAFNVNKISIESGPAKVQDIIELIGKISNLDFVIDPDVKGTTGRLSFKNKTPGFILNYILMHNDPILALIKDMNMWRIMLHSKAENYLKLIEQKAVISSVIDINNAHISERLKDLLEKNWALIVGDKKSVSNMIIDTDRKKIFLKGYPKSIEEFKNFVKHVDKSITQVRIDAIMVFAEKDYNFDFGINWSGIYNRSNTLRSLKKSGFVGAGGTLADFPEPTGPVDARHGNLFVDPANFAINLFSKSFRIPREITPSSISDTFVSIPVVFGGPNLNLKRLNLLLKAAESEEKVKIVSRPSIVTSDNEVAKILIGRSIPIQATAIDILAVAVQNITSINYKDVGIVLEVHPNISPDKKNIKLEIFIEESKVTDGTTVTNDRGIMQNPPTIDIIRIHDKVNLKNGQTVVIGGLSRCNEFKGVNKVPFLHKLPVIGKVFESTQEAKEEFEQFIFITPSIID